MDTQAMSLSTARGRHRVPTPAAIRVLVVLVLLVALVDLLIFAAAFIRNH
jgi:hypothetical protein